MVQTNLQLEEVRYKETVKFNYGLSNKAII
uniref:Uncharacterized protein n=1 Tax=Rhizophora mucronata TaxID=61149 RepID=A0A2P2QD61_RHIMU